MYNFKLYEAYKSRGLTATKLADMVGINKSRFSRILTGRLQVTANERKRLSKILRKAQKDLF